MSNHYKLYGRAAVSCTAIWFIVLSVWLELNNTHTHAQILWSYEVLKGSEVGATTPKTKILTHLLIQHVCMVKVRTLSILAHLPAIASGGVLNSAFRLPRPRPMSLVCCSRHTARSLARCPRHVWHKVATDEKYLYFFRNRLNHKSHKRSCDWTERWNWCLRHKPLKKNIGNSVYSLAKSVWMELRSPRWSGPSSPTDKNTWTYPSGTRRCLMRAVRRSRGKQPRMWFGHWVRTQSLTIAWNDTTHTLWTDKHITTLTTLTVVRKEALQLAQKVHEKKKAIFSKPWGTMVSHQDLKENKIILVQ